MTVIISGTNGINKVAANSVESGDIASGAVAQTNLASGVAGNGPAFGASAAGQTISHNTSTKVLLTNELFDTNSCYDAANSKFIPNVAGYYKVDASVLHRGTAGNQYYFQILVNKNGSTVFYNITSTYLGTGGDINLFAHGIVYMNGTTDYLELYTYEYDYTSNSTTAVLGNTSTTMFASLIRAA